MKNVVTLEDALIAHYELARFTIETPHGYLGSDGRMIARIPPANIEWSVEWGKLILTWWDEEQSQNLRISGYLIEENRVVLRGLRGLATEPLVVVIGREVEGEGPALESGPEGLPARRIWYSERLAGILRRDLPAVRIQSRSVAPAHRHHVPGRYTRMKLSRRGETILAIGVSEAEDQSTIDGIVAAGLVWLQSFNDTRDRAARARQLWFFVPRTRARTVTERLALLRIGQGEAEASCFEVDEARGEMAMVRPVSQLELLTSYPHELLWPDLAGLVGGLDEIGGEWHRRILEIAPEVIEPRYRPGRQVIAYSVHGLEFARLPINDWRSAEFGVNGDPEQSRRRGQALTERSLPALHQLVRRLIAIRSAESADHRHPFYRLRSEGWLESLLRRDIQALDPRLDPQYVYSQVPSWHADERSVIDLLAIKDDRIDDPDRGRLVVIEIKAAEDPQLPLQGLDYWLRVEQARVRGEFGRRGLFAGARIADRPPLLYLVAPRLRFHRSFTAISRSLHPQVEAWRVGLNSNWRESVRVRSFELLPDL